MAIEQISCAPDNGINDDLVAVFETDGLADLLVLDGASSVADRDYIDTHRGDVAWFVHAFVAALGPVLDPARSQADSVALAIKEVRRAYLDRANGQQVPVSAWPLAALTWIRLRHEGEQLSAALYCLGDCKAFAVDAGGVVTDLDPYANPFETVVQDALAALVREGVSDPALRRARLLPLLRARREDQHRTASPTTLCLAPQGPFHARTRTLQLAPGSAVLAMSDGFNRLADTYGLYTQDDLVRRCRSVGLAGPMQELRAHERARAASALAVKNADDASAFMWTPDGVDSQDHPSIPPASARANEVQA